MAVDMKWRDAMTVRCIAGAFEPEERAQGWPDEMDTRQLAAMQRPYEYGDSKGRRLMHVLHESLYEACRTHAIACEPDVVTVKVADEVDCTPISLTQDWPDAYTRDGVRYAYTRPARYEKQTFYWVTAADFAAWLAAEEIEPSKHIATWFKACGVTMQADSTAGAEGVAALVAQDVRDLSSLVLYRQQFAQQPEQERPQWHAEHVALLATWLRNERAQGRKRGPLTELAKRLALSRQTLGELLARHGYQSDGEPANTVVDVRSAVHGWGGQRHG